LMKYNELSMSIFLIKSIKPYSSTKGTLRVDVCSMLIKPTSIPW